MAKFKKGDRVVATEKYYWPDIDIGNIGTVVEDGGEYPYVKFDNGGYCAISEKDLELLELKMKDVRTTELRFDNSGMTIIQALEENKEENEMRNEVLELWYSRNKENISKKYKEFKDKYFEERYSIIKEYNKLIEDFESNLEYLYNNSMSDLQPVLKENNSCNVFKYVVDKDKITDEAEEVYKEDEIKEYSTLNNIYKEICALLSMSSDLEYQQSVLIEYGIIDKKTKRMIADEDSSK